MWQSEQMEFDWMDEDIQRSYACVEVVHTDYDLIIEQSTKTRKKKQPKSKQQLHKEKMNMKLEQKQLREGNGAASLRIKPGAKISAKQWARLDDRLRETAVKAGALPPYKVDKRKKKRNTTLQKKKS